MPCEGQWHFYMDLTLSRWTVSWKRSRRLEAQLRRRSRSEPAQRMVSTSHHLLVDGTRARCSLTICPQPIVNAVRIPAN